MMEKHTFTKMAKNTKSISKITKCLLKSNQNRKATTRISHHFLMLIYNNYSCHRIQIKESVEENSQESINRIYF